MAPNIITIMIHNMTLIYINNSKVAFKSLLYIFKPTFCKKQL